MPRGKRVGNGNPSPSNGLQTKRLKTTDNNNNANNNSNDNNNVTKKQQLAKKRTHNDSSENLQLERFDYEKADAKQNQQQNEENPIMDMNSSISSSLSETSFSTDILSDVRSGKILQMNLRNFMCHSNFTIEFNRNVNYLIGSNGSGKSAVITALMLALGCSANETSRGANVKQLIKNGENSATIEVIMANDDENAFEPDVYGDKITFVRHVSLNGGSSYKLKDANGKVVSTKKRDIEVIQSYLNIQPCNPIFVLTQEDARAFIKDSDEEKRYQLFMKATQLESAFKRLYECKHRCNHCEAVLTIQTALVSKQKLEINSLQLKYERLESLQVHVYRLNQLKCDQSWKNVLQVEESIISDAADIKKEEDEIKKIKSTFGEEFIQGTLNDIKELEEVIKQCDLKIETLSNDKEQWTNQLSAKATEIDQLSIQLEKSGKKSIYLKKSIVELEKKIENNIQEIDKTNALNAEKRKSKLGEKKEELDKLVIELLRLNNANQQTKNEKAEPQDRYDMLSQTRVRLHRRIAQINEDIEKCKDEINDLAVYGAHMPRLLEVIQAHFKMRKFSHLPLGPVVRYIKVKDNKWKSPVEYVLKGVLFSFVVSNRDDRLELESLIKNKFPKIGPITVLTRRFGEPLYDISRGTVARLNGTHRVIDLVVVDNPIIMNVIVDHCRIEKVIFTENLTVATNLSSKIENVPNNLIRIILTNPYSEIFPKPNYRMYGLSKNVARFIQTTTDEKREAMLIELADKKKDLEVLEVERNYIKIQLDKFCVELIEQNKAIDLLTSRRPCLELEIKNLTCFEIPIKSRIELLETELSNVKKELKSEELNLERITAINKGFQDEKNSYNERNKTIDHKISVIKKQKNTHSSKIHDSKQSIHDAQVSRSFGEQSIATGQKVITDCKKRIEENKNKLNKLTAIASKLGPRTNVNDTPEQISENIRRLIIVIQSINTDESNVDDVKKELDEKKSELHKSMESQTVMKSTLNLLTDVRIARAKQFLLYKRHMELRFQHNFIRILLLRQYTGAANFKHRKLLLTVTPNNKNKNDAKSENDHLVKSSKCLSGGERSFTTISFLLALWTCCDHAFYFLDEYDVYTDAVNREVINGLLLEESLQNPEHQYVFLTPQDASQIISNEHVTVHCFTEEIPI